MLGNWKETEHRSLSATPELERNITNGRKGSVCEEIMALLNVSFPNDSYSRFMQETKWMQQHRKISKCIITHVDLSLSNQEI